LYTETNKRCTIMKNDLTATNEKTLHVVYAIRKGEVVLETEDENTAKGMVFNDNGLDYSSYPPNTYAPNKSDIDPWANSYLEY